MFLDVTRLFAQPVFALRPAMATGQQKPAEDAMSRAQGRCARLCISLGVLAALGGTSLAHAKPAAKPPVAKVAKAAAKEDAKKPAAKVLKVADAADKAGKTKSKAAKQTLPATATARKKDAVRPAADAPASRQHTGKGKEKAPVAPLVVHKGGKAVAEPKGRHATAEAVTVALPHRKRNRKEQELLAKAGKKNTHLSKAEKTLLAKLQSEDAADAAALKKAQQAQARKLAAARRAQAAPVVARQAPRAAPRTVEEDVVPAVRSTVTSAVASVPSTAMQQDLIALQIAQQEAAPASVAAPEAILAAASTPTPAPASTSVAPAATPVAVLAAAAPVVPAPAPDPVAALVARTATPIVAEAPKPAVQAAPAVASPLRAAVPANPGAGIVRVSVPARDPFAGSRTDADTSRFGMSPELHSNVAFVMDQNTGQVLLNKNGSYVSPIASITKLMTAVITMDANLPMDEMITITEEDVDRVKRSSSRLAVGTTLSRQDMLQLALMSSENRAAHALGRTYPGGLQAAVRAMNNRALMLGMRETRYVEPTGLSSANQSSARDLALLVRAAYRYPLVRNYTTYPGTEVLVNGRMLRYNNTNRLIHSNDWDIGLQKTGYISEAGRCVVMQSNIGGRNVIIVLLDSNNTNRRVEDAESIRYWVRGGGAPSQPFGGRVVAQAAGGAF